MKWFFKEHIKLNLLKLSIVLFTLFVNHTDYSQERDTYSDTWVATDGLGRSLPTNESVGGPRENKTLGIFYYLWHLHYDDSNAYGPWDITKILETNPDNPQYGPQYVFHYWGQPYLGYYNNADKFVYAKHAQMLTDAGVDAWFFDVTNALTYDDALDILVSTLYEIRSAGRKIPKIAFVLNSSAASTAKHLYDRIYSKNKYRDLWFYWDGKPLLFAPIADMSPTFLDYFTVRETWAWNAGAKDNWTWIDTYPQKYGWHESSSVPEQISVAAASHPVLNIGRSYDGITKKQPATNTYKVCDRTPQGLYFAQQWSRALEVDPPLVFVTQWNEWIAQRFIAGTTDGYPAFLGKPTTTGTTFFVDDYNAEYNRDLEPNRGINRDNYYYQLTANIRKYKGVRPMPKSTAEKNIAVNCDFTQWNSVGPEFRDDVKDIRKRDTEGTTPAVRYTNSSGRNDFDIVKTARDADSISFYARTVSDITSPENTAWMMLFIDSDRNHATGWNGYDYLINRSRTGTKCSIEKCSGTSWDWIKTGEGTFAVKGKEIHIKTARADLGLEIWRGLMSFDFKWADNIPSAPDIMDFIDQGDVAPNARYNYRFIEDSLSVNPGPFGGSYAEIPGTIFAAGFDLGGEFSGYLDNTSGNAGGVYRTNEDVDVFPVEGESNDYYVGKTEAGEWLKYSVSVDSAGLYQAVLTFSSETSGQVLKLLVDDVDISGDVTVEKTGDIQKWAESIIGNIQLSKGKHYITLLFKSGNVNLRKIKFEYLLNGKLPVISITSPANNASFIWTSGIPIIVSASDPDGQVVKVEYFCNGNKIGENCTYPFTYVWNNVRPGIYELKALATDDKGVYSVSSPIFIQVKDIREWEWNFTSGKEGWTDLNMMSGSVSNSIYFLRINGNDPFMVGMQGIDLDASIFRYIRIVMKNMTSDKQGRLYFTTSTSPAFSEDKSVGFDLVASDTNYTAYLLDMSSDIKWRGRVTQLRLDPVQYVSSGSIELHQIKAMPVLPGKAAGSNDGKGLYSEYFTNRTLDGIPAATRTNENISFNWSSGGPEINGILVKDNFSVRWKGSIEPAYSEEYEFYTISDEGIRLWMDDSLLIDDWQPHTEKETRAFYTLEAGKKYELQVEYYEGTGVSRAEAGWSSYSQYREHLPLSAMFSGGTDGLADELHGTPAGYRLYENFPNPFNPVTRIKYSLEKTGNVILKVYDMLGREVSTLVSGIQNAGEHTVGFDASALTSGIYIYKIQSGSFSAVKKMTLIK